MPHLFQNRTSLAHTGGRDPKLQHGGCGGTGWGRRTGARAGTWLPSHGGPGAAGRRPPHTSGLAGRRAARRAPPRALQVGWPQARRGGTGTAAPQGPRPRVWSLADTGPVPTGRAPPGAAFTPEEPPPPPRPLERSFAKIQDEENGKTGSFCPRARGTSRPPNTAVPVPSCPRPPRPRQLTKEQTAWRDGLGPDTHKGQHGDARWGRGSAVLCKIKVGCECVTAKRGPAGARGCAGEDACLPARSCVGCPREALN